MLCRSVGALQPRVAGLNFLGVRHCFCAFVGAPHQTLPDESEKSCAVEVHSGHSTEGDGVKNGDHSWAARPVENYVKTC